MSGLRRTEVGAAVPVVIVQKRTEAGSVVPVEVQGDVAMMSDVNDAVNAAIASLLTTVPYLGTIGSLVNPPTALDITAAYLSVTGSLPSGNVLAAMLDGGFGSVTLLMYRSIDATWWGAVLSNFA